MDAEDGFRLYEPAGGRRATFCRLEHVIPWTIQGPHWEAGDLDETTPSDEGPLKCAQCGQALGRVRLLLVHHRGEHRVPDAFCSVEHLTDWVKAGGRWQ